MKTVEALDRGHCGYLDSRANEDVVAAFVQRARQINPVRLQ